ncbi:hypothetical protein BU24DRAFT_121929 [Aaosphaeria arxii CBS 175.79]|uniref:Uncharacterized protein n=1 Tax=Aaosphaeria arxii CBS 175.79 TaxID=1450172 RepID=A0A6A5Y1V7_9PLEO|nr:uncharacterized protein BU24DRAFT_121929 [Aaosphaeria arxii CBS 175.79]KAF2019555.1 hypothetical protein BU24DRAFT_121929 [Aaosphaeria arxii CBS 175.79]
MIAEEVVRRARTGRRPWEAHSVIVPHHAVILGPHLEDIPVVEGVAVGVASVAHQEEIEVVLTVAHIRDRGLPGEADQGRTLLDLARRHHQDVEMAEVLVVDVVVDGAEIISLAGIHRLADVDEEAPAMIHMTATVIEAVVGAGVTEDETMVADSCARVCGKQRKVQHLDRIGVGWRCSRERKKQNSIAGIWTSILIL